MSSSGPAYFSLSISGDVQVSRRLERFAERAESARPLWANIIRYLERLSEQQFSSQGKFSGGWWPLADSTVQRKGHDTILLDTGRLWDSLTGGNADSIREIGDDAMAFGTTVPYAGVHQTGGDPHPTQRRPVELTEGHRRTVMKRLQRWIQSGEVMGL